MICTAFKTLASALTLIVFGITATTWAVGKTETGPHGGQIVSNSHYKFEVKVNGKSREILAYLLEAKRKPPEKLSVILRNEGGGGPEIQLKSVTPPIVEHMPQYQGEVPKDLGSFIGMGIQFRIGTETVSIP